MRRKGVGGGRLHRRTYDAGDVVCFWCHQALPDVRVGMTPYWRGYDRQAVSDVWPYCGVVVCGPTCDKRPTLTTTDGRTGHVPVEYHEPLRMGRTS